MSGSSPSEATAGKDSTGVAMRLLAIAILTMCQFTAVPFIAMVASNAVKQDDSSIQTQLANVTVIYKTRAM
jgi:hypothetical protein